LVGLLAPEPGSALTREVADVAEDDQVAEHGAADPHAVLGPAGPDPADAALEQGGEAVPLGARRRQRVLAAAGLGQLDRVQVPAGRQGGLRTGAVGAGREGLEEGPAAVEPRLGAYQQHGREHERGTEYATEHPHGGVLPYLVTRRLRARVGAPARALPCLSWTRRPGRDAPQRRCDARGS